MNLTEYFVKIFVIYYTFSVKIYTYLPICMLHSGMSEYTCLLPLFVLPAHEWAKRVENILEATQLDLTLPEVEKKLCPALLSKLPLNIQSVLPKPTNVRNLLACLSVYDSGRLTTANMFASATSSSEKPSVQFALNCERSRKTMPPGTADAAINSLSWSVMINTLEPALKLYLPLLNIQYSPTTMQLATLDSVWEQSRPSASVNAICTSAPVNDFCTPVEDLSVTRLSSRLDNIEETLKKLLINNNNSEKSQQNNENYQADINHTNYNMNNNNLHNSNPGGAPRFPSNYPYNFQPNQFSTQAGASRFPSNYSYNFQPNQFSTQAGTPRFASNYPSNYGPNFQHFAQQGAPRFAQNYPRNYGPKYQQYQPRSQGGPSSFDPSFGSNTHPAQSSTPKNGWCAYHRNFGPLARNCAKPCSFVDPNLN